MESLYERENFKWLVKNDLEFRQMIIDGNQFFGMGMREEGVKITLKLVQYYLSKFPEEDPKNR